MEGRWTIVTLHDVPRAIESAGHVPAPGWGAVPVVPCDDAAVERVAAKLAAIQGYHVGPLEIDRRAACELLRAAGETP